MAPNTIPAAQDGTLTPPTTAPLTEQQLAEIVARHAAAEPGWTLTQDTEDPYHFVLEGDGPTTIAHFGGNPDDSTASYTVEENAQFAVNAYDDIPRLVADVRRLQAALNKGANTTDPVAVLRLALEQARRTLDHNLKRADALEIERDTFRRNLDFVQGNALPEARRQAHFQGEGKARWRDRALAAETRVAELEKALTAAEPYEQNTPCERESGYAEGWNDAIGAIRTAAQVAGGAL